ncbi:MAG: hypothetical protein KKC23_00905, partial [Proteobacteria bacterium]|nr:hypothetical protein [Pseudomonadota bacterium]
QSVEAPYRTTITGSVTDRFGVTQVRDGGFLVVLIGESGAALGNNPSDGMQYQSFLQALAGRDLVVTIDGPGVLSGTGRWNGDNNYFITEAGIYRIVDGATVLHNPGTGNTRKSPAGGSWGNDANRDISKVNWPNNKYLDSHDGYWIYLTAAETFSKLLN